MTHTLIITKIDSDPEFGRIEDEIEWDIECDGTCNLWQECSQCTEPEDFDGNEMEVHGELHDVRESYWAIIDIRRCAGQDLDSAVEAIGDFAREQHRYGDRAFEVGERIAVDLNYDGDDWWSIKRAPETHDSEETGRG